MKRFVGLCLVFALVLALAVPVLAQEKPAKKDERLRYSGNIILVSKETSSFTIQSGTAKIHVFYTDKTAFTHRNAPGGSASDLKEGKRVVVLADPVNKDRIVATRVDFRTQE